VIREGGSRIEPDLLVVPLRVTRHPSSSRTAHHVPSKSFHRTDRVAAQLRRELGTLVHEAVRELGLPSVSVSDVEVTRDMAHAKVFVTALQPERSAEAVKGLREAAKEIRYELARAVKLRHVPELHFVYDESLDRGEKIDRLLQQIRPAGDEPGDERSDA
jgi:ribosome-binding factor A